MAGTIYVIAFRHLGSEREIAVLKNDGEDFFAFPPYGLLGRGVSVHISKHKSGERHVISEYRHGGRMQHDEAIEKPSAVQLQPPAHLQGVELWFQFAPIFLGQYDRLPYVGSNKGRVIMLDAGVAYFRDDAICIKGYVVQPGCESLIPISSMGPRILHIVKETVPHIAIEVFQEAVARTAVVGLWP